MSIKSITWQEMAAQIGPLAKEERWYLMGPAKNNSNAKQPYTFLNEKLTPATGWSNLDNAVDFKTVLEWHSCVTILDERAYFPAYKTGLLQGDLIQVTLDFDDHKSQLEPLLVENGTRTTSFASRLIEIVSDCCKNSETPPLIILSKGKRGFHLPAWVSLKSNVPGKVEVQNPNSRDCSIIIEFLKSGLAILTNAIVQPGEMPVLDSQKLLHQLGTSVLKQCSTKRRNAARYSDLDWLTERDLRAALSVMSSDDYDLWIKVGLALKSYGEKGFLIFQTWSSTSEKYQGEEEIRHKWETFEPKEISIGSIFHLAKENGWRRVLPKNLITYMRRIKDER